MMALLHFSLSLYSSMMLYLLLLLFLIITTTTIFPSQAIGVGGRLRKNNHRSSLLSSSSSSSSSQSRMAKSNAAQMLPNKSLCNNNHNNGKVHKIGEYYHLPNNIVTPQRYRLRMRLDLQRNKLYGHSMITVYIHNQTNIIELNAVKLAVNGATFRTKNVRVDARMVYYCTEKETIMLHFPKFLHKGSGNLTITFMGNLTSMFDSGFVKSHSDLQLVMTDFGPVDARRQFPCWDEPQFKARFDLYLIVPKNFQALFNMPPVRRRPYSTELDEIRFRETPLISTFQLAMIYGAKFHMVAHQQHNCTRYGVQVALQIFSPYYRQPDQWHYALEASEKALHYYQYYFDQQYPLNKVDLVVLPEYGQNSLEKLGLLLFAENQLAIVNKSLASEDEFRLVAETVSHALAHQWLGNLVTFKQWNQFWLFEALATFMEKEALEALHPHWKSWERFTSVDFRRALQSDASIYAKPLERFINQPSDVLQYYTNDHSYFKAVALLRMLRSSIGDETFQKGIRLFVKNYANHTATTENLWGSFQKAIVLSNTNNKDDEIRQFHSEVVGVFSNWTKMTGFPLIHIEERQEGETRILKLRQERFVELAKVGNKSHKFAQPNKRDIWPIPVSVINSFNPFAPSHQAIIDEEEVELSISDIWEGEWIKLNPEFSNFYRVHYSESMLEKFVISIEEKLLSPMDRLNIVDDIFALIRSGHITTDVGLRLVWSYENEDNPNVWSVIVAALKDIDLLLSTKNVTLRERYHKFGQELLSKMYKKLTWYPDTNMPPVGQKMRIEDFAQRKLRENILCLMGQFMAPDYLQEANKKFQDYLNGESDLTVGLLECVFRSFSSFPPQTTTTTTTTNSSNSSNQTTFAQLFKYYEDYDIAEARQLFSLAIGSTNKTDQIDKVINFALESMVRPQDTHSMLVELSIKSTEGRRRVVNSIVKNFYTYVHKIGNFNSIHHFLKKIIETFSSYQQILALEKMLSNAKQLKLLHESLLSSFEKVRLYEQWIERDLVKIEHFLNDETTTINSSMQSDSNNNNNNNVDIGSDEDENDDNELDSDSFFDFEEFDRK